MLVEQRNLRSDADQLAALATILSPSLADAKEAAQRLVQTPTDSAAKDFVLLISELLEDFEDEVSSLELSDTLRENSRLDDMLDRMEREFAS